MRPQNGYINHLDKRATGNDRFHFTSETMGTSNLTFRLDKEK